MANSSDTSCVGVFMADSTISSRTRAALGTLADEHEAAVDVKLEKATFSATSSPAWPLGRRTLTIL